MGADSTMSEPGSSMCLKYITEQKILHIQVNGDVGQWFLSSREILPKNTEIMDIEKSYETYVNTLQFKGYGHNFGQFFPVFYFSQCFRKAFQWTKKLESQ